MTYASASILLIALTIISLFFEQLFRFDRDLVAVPFFALCVLCLVVAMYYLIRDITVSLVALELHKQSVARMRDKPGTPPTRA